MEVAENVNKYTISKHCQTRYAERIMGKEDSTDALMEETQ